MSNVELQTINQWILSPAAQDSENLASRSHETRRIPDPYIYLVADGKLISPSTYIPVEDVILRGGEIYEAEYEALIKIQEWADVANEGTVLWFSPPYLYGYSSLKIVASKIAYSTGGDKVLLNRAIVLDVDNITSLEIANSLSGKFFIDSEELRRNPIFLSPATKWVDVLSEYTTQTKQIESSEDLVAKVGTLEKIGRIYASTEHTQWNSHQRNGYAELEARERGLIGDAPDSCQTTAKRSAFNTFFGDALIENSFDCPRCHGPIPSGIGITTCPHCGLTKEEAGSTCG